VLIDGLDGDRAKRIVAQRLEQRACIGTVGLVAQHVGANGVRRQQDDAMTEAIRLPAPEVRGAAGFHHDRGRWSCGEEARELAARQAATERHRSGSVGDGELEDGLGQIDADRCMLSHVGSSFPELSGVKATPWRVRIPRGRSLAAIRSTARRTSAG